MSIYLKMIQNFWFSSNMMYTMFSQTRSLARSIWYTSRQITLNHYNIVPCTGFYLVNYYKTNIFRRCPHKKVKIFGKSTHKTLPLRACFSNHISSLYLYVISATLITFVRFQCLCERVIVTRWNFDRPV